MCHRRHGLRGLAARRRREETLWKTELRFAAPAKAASFLRPRQGVMSEYLMFTCLNLGTAAAMMLAIATAFNWVAQACIVAM